MRNRRYETDLTDAAWELVNRSYRPLGIAQPTIKSMGLRSQNLSVERNYGP